MDLSRRLNKISGPLRRARKDRQYAEDRERELRAAFFNLANEGAEEQVETFEARALGETEEKARNYLTRKYPQAEITQISYNEDGYVATMTTRPEFIGFEFVDERGRIVRRKIKGGTPTVDLDLLREVDPTMFKRVAKSIMTWEIDEDALLRYLEDHPEKMVVLERVSFPKKPVVTLDIPEEK